MIVSTLTCAAAAASKIIAATPGRSGIPVSVNTTSDSEYVTAETIGCSIPSTSCTQVPSSSENVERVDAHPVASCELDRAEHQHLGAGRGHLEHLVVRDDRELACVRDDPRVGRVHAGDVRVISHAPPSAAASATAVASVPPRPSVVISIVSRENPQARDEDDLPPRGSSDPVAADLADLRLPVGESVTIPACEPVYDTASSPRSWIAIATSAHAIRSPVERSMSSSRGFGAGETSSASAISESVDFPIAETVPTTFRLRRFASTNRVATCRTFSASATEEPPNFMAIVSTPGSATPAV